MAKVSECHLRRTSTENNACKQRNTCILCRIKTLFGEYTNFFYAKIEEIPNLKNQRRNKKVDGETLESNINEHAALTHYGEMPNPSDLELVLKQIVSYVKTDADFKHKSALGPVVKTANELNKQYTYLKSEQKKLSTLFETVSNQIIAYDKLEVAKTRLKLHQPIVDLENAVESEDIMSREKMPQAYAKSTIEKVDCEKKLRKKLNQIIYLKNLEKTYEMQDGSENTDTCTICTENLGYEWCILSCGHLYCMICNERLLKSCPTKGYVQCAMCREMCLHSESYLVSTHVKQKHKELAPTAAHGDQLEQEFAHIEIKGACNSAKVEGVVKCILKIIGDDKAAKCVVFSEHFVILDLITSLLKENDIGFTCVKSQKAGAQKSVDTFKQNEKINVLLMLYSHGANGLNLTEATHVMLVEPTLNKSQEIQAIGRISYKLINFDS